jgi:hypothetical protein
MSGVARTVGQVAGIAAVIVAPFAPPLAAGLSALSCPSTISAGLTRRRRDRR